MCGMLLRHAQFAKLQIGARAPRAASMRSALTRLQASDTLFSSRVP